VRPETRPEEKYKEKPEPRVKQWSSEVESRYGETKKEGLKGGAEAMPKRRLRAASGGPKRGRRLGLNRDPEERTEERLEERPEQRPK
jgi:hypothetical protein